MLTYWNELFFHFWVLLATKWPTSPPTLQSLNKAFFSKLMCDIRFCLTCLIDHLSNLSWRWVICDTAGHSSQNTCWVLQNVMQNHWEIKRSFSLFFYAALATRFSSSLEFTFAEFFSQSKTVNNYKITERGIWYRKDAAERWSGPDQETLGKV